MKALGGGQGAATGTWSFVFLAVVVVAGAGAVTRYNAMVPAVDARSGGTGGPLSSLEDQSAALLGTPTWSGTGESLPTVTPLLDGTVLVGSSSPLSNLTPTRDGLKKYRVRAGDTLSHIAARFGISLETLRWANPDLRSLLQPGRELIILPISGILYDVGDGDTVESVASRYGISAEAIRQHNLQYQKVFSGSGGTIVLPYAKPLGKGDVVNRYLRSLPDLTGYFALPAIGWNWGELHEYNAVDIANRCGTPVYAAAEGLVVPDDELGDGTSGWNNGYGLFVLIEHPNGTKTRYAHLAKAEARIGDFVSRGNRIAVMGNTGTTHGPTGCHLHFEVYGARNPFAVR